MSDIITVTGNIATEPEHKRTAGGLPITSFRIASTQRRFDRPSGKWIDVHTNWYSVSAFRGLAEHAFRSLHKGDRVVLTGRLRIRNWETSSSKGTAVEIDADSIGHDLLWGTTTFERSGAVVPGAPSAADEQTDAWAGDGESDKSWAPSGDWGAPGGDTGDLPETTRPDAEPSGGDRHLQLVGSDVPY